MKLTPVPHERIWGTAATQPWFANEEGRRIGEVWFDVPESFPGLIKFLFTAEDLSIQVHPPDCDGRRGKTEMWHVLRAEPGARVALGVDREVTREELRKACLDGTVLDMLRWTPARPGDTFFIPAGTVHALGAGLVVCEIQQNSDCTYRMFDFGRGRELHLAQSLEVATLTAYDGRSSLPVTCGYFHVCAEDRPGVERIAVAIEGPDAGTAVRIAAGEPTSTYFPDASTRLLFCTF